MPFFAADDGAQLGDAAPVQGTAYAQFLAGVKRTGGAVVRIPSGPQKGQLGARYLVSKAAKGKPARYSYILAPAAVIAEDAKLTARLNRDISRGSSNARAALSVAEGAARRVYRNTAGLPGRAFNAGARAGERMRKDGAAAGAQQLVNDVAAAAGREVGYVATDAGNAAKYAADKGKEVLKDAAELPRKSLAALLGVPDWMIPAMAIGAGYLVLTAYLPSHHDR